MSILKSNNLSVRKKLTIDDLKERKYVSYGQASETAPYSFYNSSDFRLCITCYVNPWYPDGYFICKSMTGSWLWLDTLEDLICLELFWFSETNIIDEYVMNRIHQMQDNFNKSYYESTPF